MKFNRGDRVVAHYLLGPIPVRIAGTITKIYSLVLTIKVDEGLIETREIIHVHAKQCRKLKKRIPKDFSSYSYHVDFSKEHKQKVSLAVGDIVKVVGEITELPDRYPTICVVRTINDIFSVTTSDVEKIGAMEKGLQIDPDGTVKKGSVFE